MSKTFIKHDIPKCTQLNLEDGRRYQTPDKKQYPSVTRVLSGLGISPYLSEWQAAVGFEEAKKISHRAANRGSKMHEACENHLNGIETKWGMFDAGPKAMYNQLIPILDRIDNVHAVEVSMWTDKLEVAGTVDLIAEIDGELSVQDWKSSSGYKSREDVPNYFKQASVYALMFYERTGIVVPRIDIHISTADHGLLTYTEKVKDWIPKFAKARKLYKEKYGF